jgi:hypothetical protein
MGRKRLMTILAGMIAAVSLQVGPAAALDLGPVKVDTSDGLKVEAELDTELTDDALKVEADVSSDPKVKVGDEVDTRKVTDPVKETVEKTVEKVTEKSEPAPEPSEGSTDGKSDGSSSSSSTHSSSSSSTAGTADDREVTTAGRTEAFLAAEREAQIEAFRAMRDARAPFSGAEFDGRVLPGVQLAPRTAPTDDAFAAPDVAPGIEVAAPSVAGEGPRQAQLASTPFSGTLPEVPIALQLLAGTLVAGTALAWHLARHELGAIKLPGRTSR